MVGRAYSKAKKHRIQAEKKEAAIAEAVKRIHEELAKPEDERQSMRSTCNAVEEKWQAMPGYKGIRVSLDTVQRRMHGGRSKYQSSMEINSWLTSEEEEQVVTFCLEYAARGFPLKHESLKIHVDSVLQARHPKNFPSSGVGKNWTNRFMERHHARLGQLWSSSLDMARGRAVNEHTNKSWFDLLGSTMKELGIEADCIWAADETGFQPGGGQTQRVIGAAGKKTQYQQRDGNRENITVMVTICADGDEIPPAVIYKGKSFSTSWHQGNELRASYVAYLNLSTYYLRATHSRSIAHSEKGWTDKIIGRLWMEDFEKKTRTKASERPRLLLVDGHNSHYAKEFLDYARAHNVHVLCYPAHATHIYQGLDVVVFGPLKECWSQELDKFHGETRQKINKTNFISLYLQAHQRAVTPQIIRTAFRVTGVWPFNPSVVTADKMAPSLETSAVGHLPIPQPSPIRALALAICQQQDSVSLAPAGPSDAHHSSRDTHNPTSPNSRQLCHVAREANNALASTSASFLTQELPLTTNDHLPQFIPVQFSPARKRKHEFLDREPANEVEKAYQDELTQSYHREDRLKAAAVSMQAAGILNGIYCTRLHRQLAAQTEKEKTTRKKKGKLMGDGLPKYLTGEEFYQRVVDHEKAAEEEELAKKERCKRKGERSEVRAAWKDAEKGRLERNRVRRQEYKTEVMAWEAERDLAKQEHRRPQWKRPVLTGIEPAVRKEGKGKKADSGNVDESGEDMDDDASDASGTSSAGDGGIED